MNSILWQALEQPAIENLHLTSEDDIMVADGIIVGLKEEKPFRAGYTVQFRPDGTVVEALVGEPNPTLIYTYAGEGRWRDQLGVPLDDFDGCTAVDIQETPFTNTLAIKQLRLSVGETAELDLIWLQLVEGTATRERQRYSCLERKSGRTLYRFEQLSSGYVNQFWVDENDLVLNYPGLFERLYPKVSDST